MQCSGLSELVHSSIGLSAPKVTEQKKNHEKFLCLLDNKVVIRCLNHNSDSKSDPNWNTIFRSACDAFHSVLEAVPQKGHSKDSGAKPKIKRAQDTLAILKKVVHLANKDAPRLDKLPKCLDYIADLLLERPELMDVMGASLVSFITADFLTCRKCVCSISTGIYLKLYKLCETELGTAGVLGGKTVSSLLKAIVSCTAEHADAGDYVQMHALFSKVMQGIKNEKATGIQEDLLHATCTYASWMSVTYRRDTCRLGEKVLDSMLCLWMKGNVSGKPLDLLIQFCSMQISIHHPGGYASNLQGAYSENPNSWNRQLLMILCATEMQLKRNDTRFRYRFKPDAIGEVGSCIELAGDALHMLFMLGHQGLVDTAILESHQLGCLTTSKIDFTDYKSLFSVLPKGSDRQASTDIRNWLRVIAASFRKHAKHFSEETTELFCEHISRVLSDIPMSDVPLLLEALTCMFQLLKRRIQLTQTTKLHDRPLSSTLWGETWITTCNILSKANKPLLLTAGLNVLTSLVKLDELEGRDILFSTGGIKHMTAIWSAIFLFLPPCDAAVQFMLTFFSTYGINCTHMDDSTFYALLKASSSTCKHVETLLCEPSLKKLPIKVLILVWLFGYKEEKVLNKQLANNTSVMQESDESEDPTKLHLNISFLTTHEESGVSSSNVLLLLCIIFYQGFQLESAFSQSETLVTSSEQHMPMDRYNFHKFVDAEFVAKIRHFHPDSAVDCEERTSAQCSPLGHLLLQHQTVNSVMQLLQSLHDMILCRMEQSMTMPDTDQVFHLLQGYFPLCNIFYRIISILQESMADFHANVGYSNVCGQWLTCNGKMITLLVNFIQPHVTKQSHERLISVFFTGVFQLVLSINQCQRKCFLDSSEFAHAFYDVSGLALAFVNAKIDQKKPLNIRDGVDPMFGQVDEFTSTQPSSSKRSSWRKRRYQEAELARSPVAANDCNCHAEANGQFCRCETPVKLSVKVISVLSKNLQSYRSMDKLFDMLLKMDTTFFPSLHIIFTACLETLPSCLEKHVSQIVQVLKDVFIQWYKDQQVCAEFLEVLDGVLIYCTKNQKSDILNNMLQNDVLNILEVFWRKYYLKGKCSITFRARLLNCLSSITELMLLSRDQEIVVMQSVEKDPVELNFSDISEVNVAVFRFLSDSHDGIKFFCSHLIQLLMEKLQSNTKAREVLQKQSLTCISKMAESLSSFQEYNLEQHLSSLSAILNAICATMLNASGGGMEMGIYTLCICVHTFFKKYGVFKDEVSLREIISSCIIKMYANAFKSQMNIFLAHSHNQNDAGLPELQKRHLKSVFDKWMQKYADQDMCKAITEFPVSIFGCESPAEFCMCNVSIIFPRVFCRMKTQDELMSIAKSFFITEKCQESLPTLRNLITTNAAEILSLLVASAQQSGISSKRSNRLLDTLFQRQNTLQFFARQHFPVVLANIVVEDSCRSGWQAAKFSFPESEVDCLCSLYELGRGPTNMTSITLCKTSATFILAELMQNVRKSFGECWTTHKMFLKLRAYKSLIMRMFSEGAAGADCSAYLIKDTVHLMAVYISFAWRQFGHAREMEDKANLCRICLECVDILLHVCRCFKSDAQSLEYLDHIENAAPLVNASQLLTNLISVSSHIEYVGIQQLTRSIGDKASQLMSVLANNKTLPTCARLMSYIQASSDSGRQTVIDLWPCMEDFLNVFHCNKHYDTEALDGAVLHAILSKMSHLLGNIESLEDSATLQNVAKDTLVCLTRFDPTDKKTKVEKSRCIAMLALHVQPPSHVETQAHDNLFEAVILDVMKVLSNRMVAQNFSRSHVALQSLYQMFKAARDQSSCTSVSKSDKHLSAVLSPFMGKSPGDTPAKLEIQGISSIDSLPAIKHLGACATHADWISSLCSSLMRFCTSEVHRVLQPACKNDPMLCSLVMPHVVHDLLCNDRGGHCRKLLSTYFDTFVTSFLNGPYGQKDSQSTQTLLSVLQYLRSQDIAKASHDQVTSRHAKKPKLDENKGTCWDNNFWLDIDYFLAAKAAIKCRQPWKAILFAEIWMDNRESGAMVNGNIAEDLCSSALLSKGNQVVDCHFMRRMHAKEVLAEAYSMINEIDCLHVLSQAGTSNDEIMVKLCEKEQNWDNAVFAYNSLATRRTGSVKMHEKIINSLECCGLGHIGSFYQHGVRAKLRDDLTNDMQDWMVEVQYETACNMAKWDDITMAHDVPCGFSRSVGFYQTCYECLSSLAGDGHSFGPRLDELRCDVIDKLSGNPEVLWQDDDMLYLFTQLACLNELTDACKLSKAEEHQIYSEKIFDAWKGAPIRDDCVLGTNLQCRQLLLSIRQMITSILLQRFCDERSSFTLRERQESFMQAELEFLMRNRQSKLCMQLLDQLKSTVKCMNGTLQPYKNAKIVFCEAKLLWCLNNSSLALNLLERLGNDVAKSLKENEECRNGFMFLLAQSMQLRGQWLNDSRMESPSVIKGCLQKSVEIAERLKSLPLSQFGIRSCEVDGLCVDGYKVLARFADLQYQEVIEYMQSNEFDRKRAVVRDVKEELRKAQVKDGSRQSQKYLTFLKRNYDIDKKDFNDILERKQKFLLSALEYYVKCLSVSDGNDILIYRMCSLWFANSSGPSVIGLMECACKQVPSFKFVQMSYQLAARLCSDSNANFQNTLVSLLCNMGQDHPYHVLPVLMALANAHKDEEMMRIASGKRTHSKKTAAQCTDVRAGIARSVIDAIKVNKPQLVLHMEQLAEAYIQLANYDASPWAKMPSLPIAFDEKLLIKKFCSHFSRNYEDLAIPTVDIPLDRHSCYADKNIVTLHSFKSHFSLCGGINLPKILIAIGSDGKERKHLVKGRDDLRQDAVMQQVFKVVNSLLQGRKESSTLRMRTYKVVPLTQCSGLVEWCTGTIPVGLYLIGTSKQKDYGAHHRYRPNDSLGTECRKKLSLVAGQPFHKKLSVFKDICSKFKPVMRHFFYEHFTNPEEWFHRRVSYSKSVATSSVIGYILGLGDRHVQNILIDCTTAELVHIDLGVAFEQGKCLPTPEMVPFRLTQDIVDGLVTGVEGVFRRNCERTLTVLKESIETVSTIVEVLLHDPLHDWMMTSAKAMMLQRHAASLESELTSVSVLNASTFDDLVGETMSVSVAANRNSLAARALLRVQEKLKGLESGAILSVEGQVNLLIQQATDYEKLCRMFAGWQPYI